MKRIILTVVITLAVVIALPAIILATGMINMAASNEPSSIEESLATFAVERSLAMRAPDETNPFAGDPQAVQAGLGHYAAMCVRCHGGPGVQPGEFAQGLNPPAPMLDYAAEKFTDGELFWITKHGIRMTGMPAFGATHEDDDVWRMVAFLKELPNLTDEQKQQLSQGGDESHGHDH